MPHDVVHSDTVLTIELANTSEIFRRNMKYI